jgi:nicotinamidase-related amidase
MGAVQGGTRVGNGLNDDPQRGACFGRKRRRALPGNQGREKGGNTPMTRVPIRDPLADHLITPQNTALIVVDYQRNQFRSVRSMDSLENVVSTAKLAKRFGLPIAHSTVGVAAGQNQSTLPELADLLEDYPPIDRTAINSWEDADFLAAVRATGRRKLILCALWTRWVWRSPRSMRCERGYEVYPVVDAIAGTSDEAHRDGLERGTQAGAQPISWISLAGELQRDWVRVETAPGIIEIVFTDRLSTA